MLPLFIKSIKAPEKPKTSAKTEATSKAKAATPDISHFADLLGVLSNHQAGGNFGPEDVEVGHHVAFKAGDFAGSGQVTSTGRDGLCVTDSSKREHRVHWREVTGHFAPEQDAKVTPKPKKTKAANGR